MFPYETATIEHSSLLAQSGWKVQDRKALNFNAALGILHKGNKTSQAKFISDFTYDFFSGKARNLIMLLDYDLLKFKVRDINEKKESMIKKYPLSAVIPGE